MIERSEEEIVKNWKGDIDKPLVSVCTITYNHENFIEEALDSFLMQETDFPFEIVIDDDYSQDSTPKIVQEYAKKYPKIIKPNLRKKNVGSMRNFIENMKRAKGEFIALCEGDDYWTDPQKLQKQADFLKRNHEVSMVAHSSMLKTYDMSGKHLLKEGILHRGRFNESDYVRPYELVESYIVQTASVMFRKEFFTEEYTRKAMKYAIGDIPLFLQMGKHGKIYVMSDTMSVYRRTESGYWSSNKGNIELQKKMVALYRDIIDDFCKDEKMVAAAKGYLNDYLYTLGSNYLKKGKIVNAVKCFTSCMNHSPAYIPKRLIVATNQQWLVDIFVGIKRKIRNMTNESKA